MLDPAIAAADALLRILVVSAREQARDRASKVGSHPLRAAPFVWREPSSLPRRDALDLAALIADPVNTACRDDLRRIGHQLAATSAGEDMAALMVEVAEIDPAFAGWRVAILEAAWAGIGECAS